VISLTDKALAHLRKLRAESGGDELLLRIGVKSGGCSGVWQVLLGQQQQQQQQQPPSPLSD